MAEGGLDAQRGPGGGQVVELLQQADDHLPLAARPALQHPELGIRLQGQQALLAYHPRVLVPLSHIARLQSTAAETLSDEFLLV